MSLLGQLSYQLYYRPLARLKRSRAAGGPWEEYLTTRGRQKMEKAASVMKPFSAPASAAPELHFLTGSPFWYQTAFCTASWILQSGQIPRAFFYDDGTLTPWQNDHLRQIFPGACVVSVKEIHERLEEALPFSHFPVLRNHRLSYPHLRKLTDIHAGSKEWRLVLDSDLLFFNKPSFLLEWLHNPERPLHAVDNEESYGYPKSSMEQLCGHLLPSRLNVGLCGLDGKQLDWEQLEFWTRQLLEKHGTHYYLEQALVAMLVAGKECSVAHETDYLTLPVKPEAVECNAVMHHYVAGSKKWYFRGNWEKIQSALSP